MVVDVAETAFDRIRDRLAEVTGKTGRGKSFACPVPNHQDKNPSLSLTQIEGSVLLHCHGGCDVDQVLAALNLGRRDLYDDRAGATYRYSSGRVVHRTPDKRFRQSGDKSTKELYRAEVLPKFGRAVFLVEGEKDVLAIETRSAIAVTAPEGAANFAKVNVEPLRGHKVTAVVDRDEAGQRWAATVAAKLAGVVESLRFVQAKTGKDAADHIAAGHALGDFEPIDAPAVNTPPARRLVAVPASSMTMRTPEWLEELRVPAGAITLLGGREGIGKSTIAFDRAARLTKGILPGKYFGAPQNVGVVATEDSWDCVIVPRLVAAGADRDRVYRIEAQDEDGYDGVSVPADVDRLAQLCAELDIVLVIVDPIISVIHGSLDTHKDREVRQALDPLSRFTARTGVAVLGLIHVNKSTTDDPLNSLMASRAFSAVARSVLYCLLDPESGGEESYFLGHPKSNLGPKQPTLTYRLAEVKIEVDDDSPPIVTSRVVWTGQDTRSIRDVMETRTERPAVVGDVAMRIAVWIAGEGRTVSTAEVKAALPDVKPATIEQNLKRMVDRRTLQRPVHGHYVSSDTRSGVLSAVSSVSSVRTDGSTDTPDSSDALTDVGDGCQNDEPWDPS